VKKRYLETQFDAGLSLKQIGHDTGLHPSTVAYWAKKYKLRSRNAERFSPRGAPDKSILQRMVGEGATLKRMADEVDRSISTIRYWLTHWGIERPDRTRRADRAVAPMFIERRCRHHGSRRSVSRGEATTGASDAVKSA
jgi:transposase